MEEIWKMDLIVRYDPEADVLVLKVREGALANEEPLYNDVVLSYELIAKSSGTSFYTLLV